MPELTHHDDRGHAIMRRMQAPAHLHRLRQRFKLFPQRRKRRARRAIKPHASKEQAGTLVVVLRRFCDVAAALTHKASDGVHDAGTVGAGKSEDE